MTSLEDLLDRAKLLRLKPGDTLVIHVADNALLTNEHAAMLRGRLEAHLPGNKVVVVQAGEVRIETDPSTSNKEDQ